MTMGYYYLKIYEPTRIHKKNIKGRNQQKGF
jgi:hypothetical protein